MTAASWSVNRSIGPDAPSSLRQPLEQRQFAPHVGEFFLLADAFGLDVQDGDLVDQFAKRARRRDQARRCAPLGKRSELARHGFEHVAPDAAARLTKEAHGRIPGRIGAPGQPAPFRVALQRDPDRNGESAGEMGDRSVAP